MNNLLLFFYRFCFQDPNFPGIQDPPVWKVVLFSILIFVAIVIAVGLFIYAIRYWGMKSGEKNARKKMAEEQERELDE